MAAFAIQRDVEGAMGNGVGLSAWSRTAARCVVRRKHAADKGDDRDAVLAVCAQRVEVPPGIAAMRDRDVEARSAKRLRAALRPDNVAIGTPAPGCVLPPHR